MGQKQAIKRLEMFQKRFNLRFWFYYHLDYRHWEGLDWDDCATSWNQLVRNWLPC